MPVWAGLTVSLFITRDEGAGWAMGQLAPCDLQFEAWQFLILTLLFVGGSRGGAAGLQTFELKALPSAVERNRMIEISIR